MDSKKSTKNVFKVMLPWFFTSILLLFAGFAAEKGDVILSQILLVGSIIMSLGFPAALICICVNSKLDERFDRLEELLKNNEPDKTN
jgi:hypothetical protein